MLISLTQEVSLVLRCHHMGHLWASGELRIPGL